MRPASFLSLLLFAITLGGHAVAAQTPRPWSVGLAGGWSSSRGYDSRWDDDRVISGRLDVWRRISSRLDLGVDGSYHRFGTDTYTAPCDTQTGGCARPQTFTTEYRSWAWSGALALRWRIADRGTVRPHALIGLGVTERRDPTTLTKRYDDDGSLVDQPERYITSTSLLPHATLGVGLELGPPASRLAVILGGRLDLGYDAYDGTPALPHLVSLTAGLMLR